MTKVNQNQPTPQAIKVAKELDVKPQQAIPVIDSGNPPYQVDITPVLLQKPYSPFAIALSDGIRGNESVRGLNALHLNPARVPLVFQGGGVLGTAYVGAIKALEELNILPSALAGSSAGAIISALLAVGYSADELLLLMKDKNFRDFLDPVCKIPVIRHIIAYLQNGYYKGDRFYQWMDSNLSMKQNSGSPTFAHISPPLLITATNITKKKLFVASQQNSYSLPVADSVRMSMSLPFIFRPVRFGESELIDGGIVNNYPAKLLRDIIPDHPILGFRFESRERPSLCKGWFDLASRMMGTAIDSVADSAEESVNDLYTIHLPTLGINVTDFGITEKQKLDLYQAGKDRTLAFFTSKKGREFLARVRH